MFNRLARPGRPSIASSTEGATSSPFSPATVSSSPNHAEAMPLDSDDGMQRPVLPLHAEPSSCSSAAPASYLEAIAAADDADQSDYERARDPPAQRRRIVGKQRVPDLHLGARRALVPDPPRSETDQNPHWYLRKKARVLYACSEAKKRRAEKEYKDALADAMKAFNSMKPEEVEVWMERARQRETPQPSPREAVAVIESTPPPDAIHAIRYTPGKLFTWNSTWLLDCQEYMSVVKQWISLPHICVRMVRELGVVKALFQDFVKVVQEVVERFRCRHFSACAEISLSSVDVGRVHLHAFLERDCRADNNWVRWDHIEEMLKVRGISKSHGVCCGVRNRGRGRDRALIEGHYYVQANKLGHICHETTRPVFKDIFPDSRMVTTLWRTRKMSTEECRSDVLRTRDKVPAVIQMLDATLCLEYAHQLEKDAETANMNWRRCPFKPPSMLELEWVRQYAVLSTRPHMATERAAQFTSIADVAESAALRRFKFLIYDGPSRMGKTELGTAWFGSARTLVVNAQNMDSVNLRPLHSGKYSAIIFDEGTWQLPAVQRALFQASPRAVELSQSQCNDRCYRVLVFRTPMIICSNHFWDGCKDLEAADWIKKNSFYVRVDSVVFEAEDA